MFFWSLWKMSKTRILSSKLEINRNLHICLGCYWSHNFAVWRCWQHFLASNEKSCSLRISLPHQGPERERVVKQSDYNFLAFYVYFRMHGWWWYRIIRFNNFNRQKNSDITCLFCNSTWAVHWDVLVSTTKKGLKY